MFYTSPPTPLAQNADWGRNHFFVFLPCTHYLVLLTVIRSIFTRIRTQHSPPPSALWHIAKVKVTGGVWRTGTGTPKDLCVCDSKYMWRTMCFTAERQFNKFKERMKEISAIAKFLLEIKWTLTFILYFIVFQVVKATLLISFSLT